MAAGRFQDDDGGSERPHTGDSRGEPCVVVADAKGITGGADVDIEVGFRDSIPTKQGCSMTRPCECGLCRPKRLFGLDDGRGAELKNGLSRPRGGRAPTHLHPPSLVRSCL
jgi:hypothetical protein